MRKNLATSKRNYENFEQEFLVLLDNHAPYKSKQTRANQVSHMTKNLRNVIIKRSQLKTIKLTQQKVCDYTRNKRTFVVSYIRKKERSTVTA